MVNLRFWRRGVAPAAGATQRGAQQEYETDEFKNFVKNNAYVLKQNVHKSGFMDANILRHFAERELLNDYNSATIGDLGPTPDFLIEGLRYTERGHDITNSRDYYLYIGTADIERDIIDRPEVLKGIWETRNKHMKELDRTNPNMTDAQKDLVKKQLVKQVLVEKYYSNKDALMGEKQRSLIVNQSLITDIANNATTPALQKFKPEVLKDLFPEGMMPYTAKRAMELRAQDASPEHIKKQIQAEEIFYNLRGMKTDDSNIPHFNDVIMASFVQAVADEKGYDTDIDRLLALDATYAFDDSNRPTKKRAAQIMRRVKDPKTVYMWLMMEEMELEARENWWKRFL